MTKDNEKLDEHDDAKTSIEKPDLDENIQALIAFDGIHDGLVFPTDEERATLKRVADKVPWNAYRE